MPAFSFHVSNLQCKVSWQTATPIHTTRTPGEHSVPTKSKPSSTRATERVKSSSWLTERTNIQCGFCFFRFSANLSIKLNFPEHTQIHPITDCTHLDLITTIRTLTVLGSKFYTHLTYQAFDLCLLFSFIISFVPLYLFVFRLELGFCKLVLIVLASIYFKHLPQLAMPLLPDT